MTISGTYRRVDRHAHCLVETRFVGSAWVTTTAHAEQGAWAPMAIIESQHLSYQEDIAKSRHMMALEAVKSCTT